MSELNPYFRMNRFGTRLKESEVGIARPVIDILLFEGEIHQQQTLDGDHEYFMPRAERIRQQWEEMKLEKVREQLRRERKLYT